VGPTVPDFHIQVNVQYQSGSGKTRKIRGISDQPADQLSFNLDSGEKVSVLDYFTKQHGINLRYGHLPCINAKGNVRVLNKLPNA